MLPPVDDSQWNSLLQQSTIDASKREAEKRLGHLDSEQIKHLRRLVKGDLFALVYGVLGYKKLSVHLHGHFCNWIDNTRAEQFRLKLLPRSHYKTTIDTVGEPIQTVLPDDDGSAPYPHNLGPNARILLGHEVHTGASRFLYEITGHFCRNPVLMGLFPELVPSPRLHRMNKLELELPRDIFAAEPTFDTVGVGGASQGRHYDKIKLDDIFGEDARDSQTERESLIQWFDNIQSLLISLAESHIDLTGTRWSLDDVYAHAMKVYGNRLRKYIRRIEEADIDGSMMPIFPEQFPPFALEILRKNPKVWAAQYVNDPHEGLAEFNPAWKRFYQWMGRDKIVIFTGKASEVLDVRNLDICLLVDPQVSRLPGILVTATDPKLRIFVLEAIKKPMKPPELIEVLFKLVVRWWPRLASIEEVVFSSVYKHWLQREMMIRNIRFNIYPYKPPRNKSKADRIRGLSNYFSAGQIYFAENQSELIEEFHNFGATTNTHLLDALAQGPEVWRASVDQRKQESNQKAEEELFAERDATTGYSII